MRVPLLIAACALMTVGLAACHQEGPGSGLAGTWTMPGIACGTRWIRRSGPVEVGRRGRWTARWGTKGVSRLTASGGESPPFARTVLIPAVRPDCGRCPPGCCRRSCYQSMAGL